MLGEVEAFFADDDVPYVSASSRYPSRNSYYDYHHSSESEDYYEPILYQRDYKPVDYGFTTHYISSESDHSSHFRYVPNSKTHVVTKILNGYSDSNDVSHDLPFHHYTDSADELFLQAIERIAGSESTPEDLYNKYFSSGDDTSMSYTETEEYQYEHRL